jgi:hypothetical protein
MVFEARIGVRESGRRTAEGLGPAVDEAARVAAKKALRSIFMISKGF